MLSNPYYGLWQYSSFSLLTWGEQHIDSGLAAILIAAAPIFTVIFAQLFLHDERLTTAKGLGILLGFIGVAVMIGPDALVGASASVLGSVAVVAAAGSYGAAFIWARLRMKGLQPMAATTGQLIMASIYTLPVALLVDRPWTLSLAPTGETLAAVLSLLALAVVGTSLAYLIYYWLVREIGATGASLVTYISPFTGLVWGAMFLGERLTVAAFIGFALLLLGLALINGWVGQLARRFSTSQTGG